MELTRDPRFDSSVGRGDFQTKIGVGQVIKGKVTIKLVSPFSLTSSLRRLGRGCTQHGWRHDSRREVDLDHHRVRFLSQIFGRMERRLT